MSAPLDPDHASDDGASPLHAAALQTSASILALQRRAQQQQAQAVALLTAVLGAVSDGLIAVDNAGRITTLNAQAVALLALPAALQVGARWADVAAHVHGLVQCAEGTPPAPDALLSGDATALDEIELSDGRVLERQVRVQHGDGTAVGRLVIYRDATARKAADRALRQAQVDTVQRLRESEQSRLVLLSALEDRQHAEAAQRAVQARLQATLDVLPDLMFEMGLDGRYHDYHALRSELLVAPPEVLLGRRVDEVLPADAAAAVMAALQQANASGHAAGHQLALDLPQGQRWFELSVARKQDVAGEATRFVVLSRDITERRQTEAALRQALAEQSALLKEVHHRVKNNLQIMHSLLRLEAGRSDSAATQTVLRDMRGRIQSMALLHESLYRSGSFSGVDLGDYLRQVATQAFRALQAQAGAVRLRLDLGSVRLALDQALPCGLLVNELIGNSLKHGFPDGLSGELRVSLQALDDGTTLLLQVSDDGVGLPPDFAARQGQSLGLQLVADLAQQLDGRLDIGPVPAAHFSLCFRPDGLPPGAVPA